MAGRTSHVRATLSIHNPPAGAGTRPGGLMRRVKFQFNPAQLELTKSANWQYTPAVATRAAAKVEFLGTNQQTLELEMFLDSSDRPGRPKVRKDVEAVLACLRPAPSSLPDRASPPWVIFEWGGFTTVRFVAYVRQVSASYTLFSSTGEPVRAVCRLSLEEIPRDTPGQNPTSGALTARSVHTLVAGDTLASLAWREYGDATAWRVIAEANEIDDPMRLVPGRELLLPAAEEMRA
ncbi:LysM domain-containing protein [Actinomadura pelletieri DSM 43383]|uniref:LysM domain-containing protein n=2 Tax=Actinomadura TaxID=1988 RepID=A0A372GDN7_9ACTN|nr:MULTISPECIES: LysM peptidoglycan-binding domain-containing protein [Actinomadura]RFS83460.1 LysM domain-containing protein [Actinomadura spongiicola]RKS70950.1 LysM domain-containing protein [Actinomadura pelletieri DSM 43383]